MPTGDRRDPYRVYNFLVEIDGIECAVFRECSGLDKSNDAIRLKWGIIDDATLWAWRKAVMDGAFERKNGSIVLRDDAGDEKLRWNFRDGWPTKWTGPSMNASGNEFAIEALEIAHEGLVKA